MSVAPAVELVAVALGKSLGGCLQVREVDDLVQPHAVVILALVSEDASQLGASEAGAEFVHEVVGVLGHDADAEFAEHPAPAVVGANVGLVIDVEERAVEVVVLIGSEGCHVSPPE